MTRLRPRVVTARNEQPRFTVHSRLSDSEASHVAAMTAGQTTDTAGLARFSVMLRLELNRWSDVCACANSRQLEGSDFCCFAETMHAPNRRWIVESNGTLALDGLTPGNVIALRLRKRERDWLDVPTILYT